MNHLENLKGVGTHTTELLEKLGIFTIEDLVTFYPFRYNILQRTNLLDVESDGKVIVDGVVESLPNVFFIHKKLNKMNFILRTNNSLVHIIIFNRAFLKSRLSVGTEITIFGKYDKRHNTITANDIRFSKLSDEVKIEAVYHTVYGLSSKKLESVIHKSLLLDSTVEDYIPLEYREKYKFLSKRESILELHRPSSLSNLKRARLRTKYEELFIFMIRMEYLKNNQTMKEGLERKIEEFKVKQFIDSLPFRLTEDQYQSIQTIYNDLSCSKRMNRLLQGDVGSGKTIVAIVSMYMNYLGGYQSALMAPTEILAEQHYTNLLSLMKEFNISISLLTGKTCMKEKREIYDGIRTGKIDIVIGTHALISEKLVYNNLGLVVTDEQHRFGVRQRSNLKNKGYLPDILYMSATPIPRTYALALYGDMDISNIKTRPHGRKKIITKVKKDSQIKDVLQSMYEQLQSGHQIYVIAPLIEESENMDLENVKQLYEKMNRAFGKQYNISVLHGKLKKEEKGEVMKRFSENNIQILISTTVIEVGIDVPNATMIVIFDAFRFGLSTLHQLRGRVGRNDLQSYCFLISNSEIERLEVMEREDDGFKISEEDFRLRGSGDLFGTKQSGDMKFMIADIKRDFSILLKAKEDSALFLKDNEDHECVKKILEPVLNIES